MKSKKNWKIIRKETKKNHHGLVVSETEIEEQFRPYKLFNFFIKILGIITIALPVWLFYSQNNFQIEQKKKEKISDLYEQFSVDVRLLNDSAFVNNTLEQINYRIHDKYQPEIEILQNDSIYFYFDHFKELFEFWYFAQIAINNYDSLLQTIGINNAISPAFIKRDSILHLSFENFYSNTFRFTSTHNSDTNINFINKHILGLRANSDQFLKRVRLLSNSRKGKVFLNNDLEFSFIDLHHQYQIVFLSIGSVFAEVDYSSAILEAYMLQYLRN